MKFFASSIVLSFVLFFSHGLAVPVAEAGPNPGPGPVPEPENGLTERDAGIFKGVTTPPQNCPTQVNQCSTGVPYCCSTDSGKHNCVQSTVSCQQTVICCNNNFGFQMCIGNIDFNMPINININV